MVMAKKIVARRSDPSTSWEAAKSIDPRMLGASKQQVLRVIQRHGPMTDETLVRKLEPFQSHSGIRTRRKELVDAGLVRDSGKSGVTKSGRRAIKWEACDGQNDAD